MSEEKKKGFAAFTPEKRRACAAKGGRMAHANGKGHKFDPTAAAENGRKGAAVKKAKQVIEEPVEEQDEDVPLFIG